MLTIISAIYLALWAFILHIIYQSNVTRYNNPKLRTAAVRRLHKQLDFRVNFRRRALKLLRWSSWALGDNVYKDQRIIPYFSSRSLDWCFSIAIVYPTAIYTISWISFSDSIDLYLKFAFLFILLFVIVLPVYSGISRTRIPNFIAVSLAFVGSILFICFTDSNLKFSVFFVSLLFVAGFLMRVANIKFDISHGPNAQFHKIGVNYYIAIAIISLMITFSSSIINGVIFGFMFSNLIILSSRFSELRNFSFFAIFAIFLMAGYIIYIDGYSRMGDDDINSNVNFIMVSLLLFIFPLINGLMDWVSLSASRSIVSKAAEMMSSQAQILASTIDLIISFSCQVFAIYFTFLIYFLTDNILNGALSGHIIPLNQSTWFPDSSVPDFYVWIALISTTSMIPSLVHIVSSISNAGSYIPLFRKTMLSLLTRFELKPLNVYKAAFLQTITSSSVILLLIPIIVLHIINHDLFDAFSLIDFFVGTLADFALHTSSYFHG